MNDSLLRRLRNLARRANKVPDKEALCSFVAGVGASLMSNHPLLADATELRRRLLELGIDERHYAASTLLALSLGEARRKKLAAFFTPPFIVQHALDSAIRAGLDLRRHSVVDPAAGGAAFLSPLAGRMRDIGCSPEDIRMRLFGVELDPHLATLANRLIEHRIGSGKTCDCVRPADALLLSPDMTGRFDCVLANPPYGRLTGTAATRLPRFADLVHPGHVNRYALFAGLATSLVRDGGVVVLVIPASFLTGPLFGPLRAHFRRTYQIESVDLIAERKGTFLDVQQEACVLTLKKIPSVRASREAPLRFSEITASGRRVPLGTGDLPTKHDDPWKLPSPSRSVGAHPTATLDEYGVEVRAGYFVWNREKRRMSKGPKGVLTVPLIWADNVRKGRWCYPAARSGDGVDYVTFDEDSPSIIREQVIVLQRTTNNRQPRRLVAALVPAAVAKRYGGFVSENHTLIIRKKRPDADLSLVNKLLNTEAVDRHLRRLLTGANVSVASLRALELPSPKQFVDLLRKTKDAEVAAMFAYQMAPAAPVDASSDGATLVVR
jgi:adenine-specific DNA-methyltransferase